MQDFILDLLAHFMTTVYCSLNFYREWASITKNWGLDRRYFSAVVMKRLWKKTAAAIHYKVDRVTANHSLSSTASQGTSNIPFPCFLVLGCNRQALRESTTFISVVGIKKKVYTAHKRMERQKQELSTGLNAA